MTPQDQERLLQALAALGNPLAIRLLAQLSRLLEAQPGLDSAARKAAQAGAEARARRDVFGVPGSETERGDKAWVILRTEIVDDILRRFGYPVNEKGAVVATDETIALSQYLGRRLFPIPPLHLIHLAAQPSEVVRLDVGVVEGKVLISPETAATFDVALSRTERVIGAFPRSPTRQERENALLNEAITLKVIATGPDVRPDDPSQAAFIDHLRNAIPAFEEKAIDVGLGAKDEEGEIKSTTVAEFFRTTEYLPRKVGEEAGPSGLPFVTQTFEEFTARPDPQAFVNEKLAPLIKLGGTEKGLRQALRSMIGDPELANPINPDLLQPEAVGRALREALDVYERHAGSTAEFDTPENFAARQAAIARLNALIPDVITNSVVELNEERVGEIRAEIDKVLGRYDTLAKARAAVKEFFAPEGLSDEQVEREAKLLVDRATFFDRDAAAQSGYLPPTFQEVLQPSRAVTREEEAQRFAADRAESLTELEGAVAEANRYLFNRRIEATPEVVDFVAEEIRQAARAFDPSAGQPFPDLDDIVARGMPPQEGRTRGQQATEVLRAVAAGELRKATVAQAERQALADPANVVRQMLIDQGIIRPTSRPEFLDHLEQNVIGPIGQTLRIAMAQAPELSREAREAFVTQQLSQVAPQDIRQQEFLRQQAQVAPPGPFGAAVLARRQANRSKALRQLLELTEQATVNNPFLAQFIEERLPELAGIFAKTQIPSVDPAAQQVSFGNIGLLREDARRRIARSTFDPSVLPTGGIEGLLPLATITQEEQLRQAGNLSLRPRPTVQEFFAERLPDLREEFPTTSFGIEAREAQVKEEDEEQRRRQQTLRTRGRTVFAPARR